MSWLKELGRSNSQQARPPPVPDRLQAHDDGRTPENKTLFQTFEWHTPSQGPNPHETHARTSHYGRLARIVPSLADIGVTMLWLPPGCKANNIGGNGYDCYDLWDLGEFDQKYTRSTKWGSREELRDLQDVMSRHGVEGCWDAVLNHKTAGDATEECWAVEVDGGDRRIETCAPKKIEAWIKYDFPGRKGKYSKFRWRHEHFNGIDWDQRAQKNAIYKLVDDPATFPKPGSGSSEHQHHPAMSSAMEGMNRLARLAGKVTGAPMRRPGKGWAEDVDDMHGNYDYLMFANIDYTHPEVRQDTVKWGEWMTTDNNLHGFRLDAVQHFSYAFSREWICAVHAASHRQRGKPAFIVGEIWTNEVKRIIRWLDVVDQGSHCYDSPLLYNFSRISTDVITNSRNADLRTLTRDSLLSLRPSAAVTLVSNHDTQPGQASYTHLDIRLKTLFYTFILLRAEGLPCVFWGDLYGTQGPHPEPPACISPTSPRSLLPDLVLARKLFAYGEQTSYFDAASVVGWTRAGTHDREGCAVVLNIGSPKTWAGKKMAIGRPGERWVDLLGEVGQRTEVVIDGKGFGEFSCRGWGAGVFVRKEARGLERFPREWDLDVYRHG